MSDYISREAAKQILSRLLTDEAAECACNLIESVLPADVGYCLCERARIPTKL